MTKNNSFINGQPNCTMPTERQIKYDLESYKEENNSSKCERCNGTGKIVNNNFIEEVEKEFDKEFPEFVVMSDGKTYKNVADKTKVRAFISQKLQEQREELNKEIVEIIEELQSIKKQDELFDNEPTQNERNILKYTSKILIDKMTNI